MTNEELKHAFMKDTLVKAVNPCPLPHGWDELTGRIEAVKYSKDNGKIRVLAEIRDKNALYVISAEKLQPFAEKRIENEFV